LKILFIANRFPYPPYRGDKLKIYNLANILSRQHEIHLITFSEQPSDYEHLQEVAHIFKEIRIIDLPKWKSFVNVAIGMLGSKPLQVNYFKSAKFRRVLKDILVKNQYDAIHVQHLRMAQYAIAYKDQYRILDMPDAFSLYWQRRKTVRRNLFTRLLDHIESARVMKYESYILGKFNLNLVCSSEDLAFLEQAHSNEHIKLLPNGVDTTKFRPMDHDYGHNHTLLFTGNMDYAPNVDAVIYFSEEVFPLISEKFPDVKFIIAGQRPIDKVKALDNGKNISVTGFIADLSEMYNSASVVVAPLRFGAGTQNKVLEAMAMGIPVVCSHIGFEGLGIQDGEGAFMRTDKESFAKQVCALLADKSLRETTGKKGTEVISRKFSWETIARMLEEYFREGKK
jgi:sugar transferase (PEP-CTERM/EpsH1 system associated)